MMPTEPLQDFAPQRFDIAAFQVKEAARKREIIAKFIEAHQLQSTVIEMKGKKFLLLEPDGLAAMDGDKVAQYIAQHIIANEKIIVNECFAIANDACTAGFATGRLAAYDGTTDFAGYLNHCINFDELSDSVVAFDLTASSNIDQEQGKFDILAVRTASIEELLQQLNELYGGNWQVIHIN